MMKSGEITQWFREKGKKLAGLRYPLLILLLGLVLLMLPGGREESAEAVEPVTETQQPEDDLRALEQRLSQLLSQVEGAGKVEVLLSVTTHGETLYQTDSRTDSGETNSQETTTVLFDDGNGTQSPLVRQQISPVFQGAVILSQGAGNPGVKLALVEAVADLTGLTTDRITVVKMK